MRLLHLSRTFAIFLIVIASLMSIAIINVAADGDLNETVKGLNEDIHLLKVYLIAMATILGMLIIISIIISHREIKTVRQEFQGLIVKMLPKDRSKDKKDDNRRKD